jgi:hypothetical protein
MSDNKTTSSGIGFTGLLLIAFIVLKLCNVINWSWWWVLSPAWITAGIASLLLGAIGVLEYLSSRSRARQSKKYREATKDLYNALDNALDTANKSRSKWQERLDQVEKAQREKRQQELREKLNRDA